MRTQSTLVARRSRGHRVTGSSRPAHVLAAAMGLFIVTSGQPARATNYTITVDASKQTAGNPRFWSASRRYGHGQPDAAVGSADALQDWRTASSACSACAATASSTTTWASTKGAGSYDWTNFDKYLTAIVSAGMRPLMELDFMPTALGLDRQQS